VSSRRTHDVAEVAAYLLVLLALMAWSFVAASGHPLAPEGLIGSAAPGLSGPNLNGEGTIDLASMEGQPTVVVFWFPWCSHCQTMLPALQEAWHAASPDANIMTAGMAYYDPDVEPAPGFETPEAFVRTTGLTLPSILADWDSQGDAWGFQSVPTTYVLDADHVVRRVFVGSTDPTTIIEAISGA
jgi:thiol-disulfide isomerase/thioredoxin